MMLNFSFGEFISLFLSPLRYLTISFPCSKQSLSFPFLSFVLNYFKSLSLSLLCSIFNVISFLTIFLPLCIIIPMSFYCVSFKSRSFVLASINLLWSLEHCKFLRNFQNLFEGGLKIICTYVTIVLKSYLIFLFSNGQSQFLKI
jgi:hypothetical protein